MHVEVVDSSLKRTAFGRIFSSAKADRCGELVGCSGAIDLFGNSGWITGEVQMRKLKLALRSVTISLAMFLQLQFVKFFFIDSCLDRGGRFLYDELMCESGEGFISFNLAPVFYILTSIVFGLFVLGMLELVERLTRNI